MKGLRSDRVCTRLNKLKWCYNEKHKYLVNGAINENKKNSLNHLNGMDSCKCAVLY
jgi:hypothetical protein